MSTLAEKPLNSVPVSRRPERGPSTVIIKGPQISVLQELMIGLKLLTRDAVRSAGGWYGPQTKLAFGKLLETMGRDPAANPWPTPALLDEVFARYKTPQRRPESDVFQTSPLRRLPSVQFAPQSIELIPDLSKLSATQRIVHNLNIGVPPEHRAPLIFGFEKGPPMTVKGLRLWLDLSGPIRNWFSSPNPEKALREAKNRNAVFITGGPAPVASLLTSETSLKGLNKEGKSWFYKAAV